MKVYLHTDDITRLQALMEALDYDGTFELEVDNSSGIGTTVIAHVPQAIQSLSGTFSYTISDTENW
jgi:hypothetical protein